MLKVSGEGLREATSGSPLGAPGDERSTARAVQNMFGAVAPRYDFLNHFFSLGCDVAWRRATAKAVAGALGRPGSLALDLCCGTGDLAFAFSRVSAGMVIGVDFCFPMLKLAARKSETKVKRPVFFAADAIRLPFADASLDLVSSAFGFRNLASYAKGLEEMRRVLKPGGVVAILEFSRVRWPVFRTVFAFYFRHVLPRIGTWVSGVRGAYQYLEDSASRFPDQQAFASALAEAGFTNVRYRNFSGGVAALHTGRRA